jgi:hypothetical protein
MRNAWRTTVVAAAAILSLPAPRSAAAERPWIEVRSPHFTVVSNAGEHPAQEIAWQFEHVRAVFDAVWPWARRDESRPFIVFVARDEATLRALAPQYWTSRNRYGTLDAHASGADADYSAIRVDYGLVSPEGRNNPYESAFEGYADNVLVRHFSGQMPLWFREGLIELFGNVVVEEKDVQIGRPIREYVYLLSGGVPAAGRVSFGDRPRGGGPAARTLLPLERLIAVRREDPEFTGDGERSLYSAQVWAFVHFLMFADGGAHRAGFNRLMDILRAGRSGDEATGEALGDVSLLNKAYRDYIDKRYFQSQRVAATISVDEETWPVRTLSAAESDVLHARFLAANRQIEPARARIAAARQADPSFAGIADAEALVEGRAPRRAAAVTAPTTGAPTPGPAAPDPIRACSAGDDAACGRLATRLQAECDHDAAMCMPLAFLYANGRGVPRDPMQAEDLYARACEAGQARACEKQARMILEQSGAEGNVAQARELLQRACAAGEKTACGGIDKR